MANKGKAQKEEKKTGVFDRTRKLWVLIVSVHYIVCSACGEGTKSRDDQDPISFALELTEAGWGIDKLEPVQAVCPSCQ